LKGKLTGVWGDGIDHIARAEGWVKHRPSYFDLKVKFEQKDGVMLQKHRLQFMPLQSGNVEVGLAYRYKKKEDKNSVGVLGVAVRMKGENWKIPVRYYPEINLFHSKPAYRSGRLRTDCQIIFDHHDNSGSLRPGVDWKISRYFSAGTEARFYDNPEKNYIGLRLSLMAKN
jgi:hypothetical protein